MMRWPLLVLSIFFLAGGCARDRHDKHIISQALPLTMGDIDEIRAGDEAHLKIFKEKSYALHPSPELNAYITLVGRRIAKASDRPNLPYQFYVLDSDKVDIFGLGGGRVYVTRGFINFVGSESELAGGIAHEIGHIASYHYRPAHRSRWETVYDLMLKGADQAKGAMPPFSSAAPYGVKVFRFGILEARKRFTTDQEKRADELAIHYLVKAGYDPIGLLELQERISQVTVENIGYYVDLLKAHPPFEGRRKFIEEKVKRAEKEFRKKKEEESEKTLFTPGIEALLIDPEAQIAQLPAQQDTLPTVEPQAFASQS